MILFEAKAKYDKINKDGKQVTATENFIMDAVSFTEAESVMFRELEKLVSGSFSVENIAKSKIAEVHITDGDIIYKGTVEITTISDSGKEKKSKAYLLVSAYDLTQADARIREIWKGSISDWEVKGVVDSNIVEYIPHVDTDDED